MSSDWAASALIMVGGSGRRHDRRRGAARLAQARGPRPPERAARTGAGHPARHARRLPRLARRRPTPCPSRRPPRRGPAPAGDPAAGPDGADRHALGRGQASSPARRARCSTGCWRRSAAAASPSISPRSRRSARRPARSTSGAPPSSPRSRATISASPRPRRCCCSATPAARRWSDRPVAGARARWHDVQTAAGAIKTLVTIRPEKLVKQPALKALAWADLQMLMEELKP